MRYSRKSRPFSGEMPELKDPRWREWTRPLLAFLSEPRTWEQLKQWSKEHKVDGHFLRQQLAWLEDRKLAASVPSRKGTRRSTRWVWFSAQARRRETVTGKTLAKRALKRATKRRTDKGGEDERRRGSGHPELPSASGD